MPVIVATRLLVPVPERGFAPLGEFGFASSPKMATAGWGRTAGAAGLTPYGGTARASAEATAAARRARSRGAGRDRVPGPPAGPLLHGPPRGGGGIAHSTLLRRPHLWDAIRPRSGLPRRELRAAGAPPRCAAAPVLLLPWRQCSPRAAAGWSSQGSGRAAESGIPAEGKGTDCRKGRKQRTWRGRIRPRP
jgi:hypothetical protein